MNRREFLAGLVLAALAGPSAIAAWLKRPSTPPRWGGQGFYWDVIGNPHRSTERNLYATPR